MRSRAADRSDIASIFRLQRAYDIWSVGKPEDSEAEVLETYKRAEDTRVILNGDDVVGYAAYWRTGSHIIANPREDMEKIYQPLMHWLTSSSAPEARASDCDKHLRRVAVDQGWHHANSTFDLLRTVTPDWVVRSPSWQKDYRAAPSTEGEHQALHRLIYHAAGWSQVPGHHHRGFDEWHRLFFQPRGSTQPLLAWHSERMVGAALARVYDDGTGWITQLAVLPEERRRGIARNLLLLLFTSLIECGVTSIGLAVSGANRAATTLYTNLGLEVKREWAIYLPPFCRG